MGCSDSITADVIKTPQAAIITKNTVFEVIGRVLAANEHIPAVREYIVFRTFIMQLPQTHLIKHASSHKLAMDYSAAMLRALYDHPEYEHIRVDTIMLCLLTNPNVRNGM